MAGPAPGFSVTTDELNAYVRTARRIAGELDDLAKRQVHSVRTIAQDSFGRVGRDSGFAAALDHFADALEKQVSGVASNAGKLSDAVAGTARVYQHQDEDLAQQILNLLT